MPSYMQDVYGELVKAGQAVNPLSIDLSAAPIDENDFRGFVGVSVADKVLEEVGFIRQIPISRGYLEPGSEIELNGTRYIYGGDASLIVRQPTRDRAPASVTTNTMIVSLEKLLINLSINWLDGC